ncbi:replication restart helicase PriA [Desulfuromonas versatilis]|uniref:replication restart helicase PriA n=1 Tax=Desulfuromonas versatilis TaxID=2802975 RepID=UPI001CECF2FF|nr:primosomal protein N' [Desulfuromonas versatilis]
MKPSLVATVAVAAPLDKLLSYLLPAELRERARVGVRLRVPLGRRSVVGYLLGVAEGEAEGLKPVAEVLDEAPLFPPAMIDFFLRAAEYYCHPPGEVIRTALPAGLSGRGAEVSILQERFYRAAPRGDEPPGARQRQICQLVRERGQVALSELREHFAAPHAPLRRLVELGFLEEESGERLRDPFLDQPPPPDSQLEPTPDQARALEQLRAKLGDGFAPFLLHGVTGSGKTEVYLRIIAAALQRGARALVLVPEIALTPQLVGRFRARFAAAGTGIAVLHSGLSDGERYDAWRAIARGAADIVIGARSAVFAPLERLGVIVVDEEHEASYKQAEGFRYHARDLALLRGQMSKTLVLLGSATPALTTFHRAREGQSGYLPLAARAQERPLPAVELVDLVQQRPEGVLSAPLVAALGEVLEARQQALLLLNRRGFSPYLLCGDCGQSFRCPNCEITLTYYQKSRRLRCHYCDFSQAPPELCPRCSGGGLAPEGAGTERLEEELEALFPQARIARMDRDSTTRKGSHQQLVERMSRGEVDILIGTQMIAKGHDFPGVTLVGVVGADSSLNFPDFRSAERTFALLTQVAGRAGRAELPGRVYIQTFAPEHYALQCAALHDYQGFYEQEIAFRQELGYPPFGYLVNLVLAGNDPGRVNAAATALAEALADDAGEAEVLGPAPCPLARLRGKTRMQVLLKAPRRPPLRRLLVRLDVLRRKIPAGVALAVDVDPVDML